MCPTHGGSEYRPEVITSDVALADGKPVNNLFGDVVEKLIGKLPKRIRLVAPPRSAPQSWIVQ